MNALINLSREIEIRKELNEELDRLILVLESQSKNAEEIAMMLLEVSEIRKECEEKESILKNKLKSLFTTRPAVMEFEHVLVTLTKETRKTVERAKLEAAFGVKAIEPFLKVTESDKLVLRRKS